MVTINIKKNSDTSTIPMYQTKGSAGADMYADIAEPITINPHETVIIPSNIAMEIPSGMFGAIYPRSGLSTKKGLVLANCVAVIDEDFRGSIGLPIHNHSEQPKIVEPNERVAQIVFQEYKRVVFKEVEQLSETDRGSGGFGHTGNK